MEGYMLIDEKGLRIQIRRCNILPKVIIHQNVNQIVAAAKTQDLFAIFLFLAVEW